MNFLKHKVANPQFKWGDKTILIEGDQAYIVYDEIGVTNDFGIIKIKLSYQGKVLFEYVSASLITQGTTFALTQVEGRMKIKFVED